MAKETTPYPKTFIYTGNSIPLNEDFYISESLKGLVSTDKKKFPVELGEEHLFEYSKCEKLTKRFGLISAIVDKHIDFIMSSGIHIAAEDERAQQIIEDFMKDFEFDTLVRQWLREAFIKGNGFMEIGYDQTGMIDGLKILDAEYMYIIRDDKGNIKGYNQYTKQLTGELQYSKKEVEKFSEDEIAHLALNKYGDNIQGLGIIFPLISMIDDLIGARKEMHTMMRRKANSPLIFILGDKSNPNLMPTESEINSLGEKLTYMNNKNEWVLSDLTKPMTLDFGNVGDKFSFIIENDQESLFMAAQIPSVIMGKANVAEGLASANMRAWELRITSLREEIEKVIEEKIFKTVLNANGIDSEIEIVWGVPSEEEKIKRLDALNKVLSNMSLSPKMKTVIEQKIADLLDITEEELMDAEEQVQQELDQAQPIMPNQRITPPTSQPKQLVKKEPNSQQEKKCSCCEEYNETLDNMTVTEFVGMPNFNQMKNAIISFLQKDPFYNLKADTKEQKKAGLLSFEEVEKLRTTLHDGFKHDMSMRDIASNLKKRIEFKDRYKTDENDRIMYNQDDEPIIAVRAEDRPIMIARSEVVRVSNAGTLKNYVDNGIEKVRWISAINERTCEECSSLNGMIFESGKAQLPPLHTNCRCTIGAVLE